MISWLLFPSPHRYFLTTFEQWMPFHMQRNIKENTIWNELFLSFKAVSNNLSYTSFPEKNLEVPLHLILFPNYGRVMSVENNHQSVCPPTRAFFPKDHGSYVRPFLHNSRKILIHIWFHTVSIIKTCCSLRTDPDFSFQYC